MNIEAQIQEYLNSGKEITQLPSIENRVQGFPKWKKYSSTGRKKIYQGGDIAAYKVLKIMGW
jgi:hypothetical protein